MEDVCSRHNMEHDSVIMSESLEEGTDWRGSAYRKKRTGMLFL
jgi:hypothetical protein